MDGVGGYSGWRWIFILEGLATVVVAVGAYFVLYDFPDTASFLTEEERAWVVHRLRYQESDGQRKVAENDEFKWKYVKDAFTDWQIYLGVVSTYLTTRPSAGDGLQTDIGLSVLGDCLSPLWNFSVPAYNYQGARIHILDGAASDCEHTLFLVLLMYC